MANPITVEHMYDARSSTYDNSWHPRFASHIVQLANPAPGECVLDLACGTGLVSFLAAQAVGPKGRVIGVDVSSGMLDEARKKQNENTSNLGFVKGNIERLSSLPEVNELKGKVDLITCASALVLLSDPFAVVKHWAEYLAPDGRMIVDVTHPRNQVVGICMERVGKRLARHIPHFRLNFQSQANILQLLRDSGFGDLWLWNLSQLDFPETRTEELEDFIVDPARPRVERIYRVDAADEIFEATMQSGETYASLREVRDQARGIFREEWAALGDENGNVTSLDWVWVAMGRKWEGEKREGQA